MDFFGITLFGVGLLHPPRSRRALVDICNYLLPPCSLCVFFLMNCKIRKDNYLALSFLTVSPRPGITLAHNSFAMHF